jgi:hypothetical protein
MLYNPLHGSIAVLLLSRGEGAARNTQILYCTLSTMYS